MARKRPSCADCDCSIIVKRYVADLVRCRCGHPEDRHVGRCAFPTCGRLERLAGYCAAHTNVYSLDYYRSLRLPRITAEDLERKFDATAEMIDTMPIVDDFPWIPVP